MSQDKPLPTDAGDPEPLPSPPGSSAALTLANLAGLDFDSITKEQRRRLLLHSLGHDLAALELKRLRKKGT